MTSSSYSTVVLNSRAKWFRDIVKKSGVKENELPLFILVPVGVLSYYLLTHHLCVSKHHLQRGELDLAEFSQVLLKLEKHEGTRRNQLFLIEASTLAVMCTCSF
jgi:hypothetical protein